MRISDWSSDVCSSDRCDERDTTSQKEDRHDVAAAPMVGKPARRQRKDAEGDEGCRRKSDQLAVAAVINDLQPDHHGRENQPHIVVDRSEESRVGKEGVSTGRSWWWPLN